MFIILTTDEATEKDISTTIRLLGVSNSDLDLEISGWLYDHGTVVEIRNTNSYNKALLQAGLDSN